LNNQLDRELRIRRTQDEALQTLRNSAEEVTLLEAEEIARLETKLEVFDHLSVFIVVFW